MTSEIWKTNWIYLKQKIKTALLPRLKKWRILLPMWQDSQFTAVTLILRKSGWVYTASIDMYLLQNKLVPLPKRGRQKHPIKNTYKILRHNWNTNHCPKAWNFPTRLNPLLLQPTLNGGATSTTPSPLTKSIGIFLLVDYEEGKKNLHLQKHSLQNISAKHMTKFNHNKTPETNPTNISSNIQHSGMMKRSIQLTPSLWISFVVS